MSFCLTSGFHLFVSCFCFSVWLRFLGRLPSYRSRDNPPNNPGLSYSHSEQFLRKEGNSCCPRVYINLWKELRVRHQLPPGPSVCLRELRALIGQPSSYALVNDQPTRILWNVKAIICKWKGRKKTPPPTKGTDGCLRKISPRSQSSSCYRRPNKIQ